MRFSVDDYMMGRAEANPPTEQMWENAAVTVALANELLDEAAADGVPLNRMDQITGTLVACGYRPPSVNSRTANAATHSTHLTCEAVDIQDSTEQHLARWCLKNLQLLERLGLWMENPRWTFSVTAAKDHWVHLQTRPPGSGNRVYVPSKNPPLGPELT